MGNTNGQEGLYRIEVFGEPLVRSVGNQHEWDTLLPESSGA